VPVRVAVRSRIVLLAAEGKQNKQIGEELKISTRIPFKNTKEISAAYQIRAWPPVSNALCYRLEQATHPGASIIIGSCRRMRLKSPASPGKVTHCGVLSSTRNPGMGQVGSQLA
jgi:hypothetical protein